MSWDCLIAKREDKSELGRAGSPLHVERRRARNDAPYRFNVSTI